MKVLVDKWENWFAWYPVWVGGRLRWFRRLQRQRVVPLGPMEIYEAKEDAFYRYREHPSWT